MQNRIVADLGKTIAILVLIIILLMPIFIGKMHLPWWRINESWSEEYEAHGNMTKEEAGEGSITVKTGYDFCLEGIRLTESDLFDNITSSEIYDYNEDSSDDTKTSNAFGIISIMLLIGFFMTIISIIFIFITNKKKMPIKITMLVSLIAAIFLLIASLYFVIQVPRAARQDTNREEIKFFVGHKTWDHTTEGVVESELTWTWFPHIAFFLALTALIINLHAVLGMHKNKRSYTYIPKKRGDLLYQQNQSYLPEGLIMQPPQPQPKTPTPQPKNTLPPGMSEFKTVVEEDLDEKRIQEIHQERLKMLKELKAEADLEEMLEDYDETITKIEEEEEAAERELSALASKRQFNISEIVNFRKGKKQKNLCPKCKGELEIKKDIIICKECGSKFREKKEE